MSFYHLPNPWDPHYAIPDYVMAEPPGRGTFTTQWMPRGTIPELVPDFLAKPGQKLLGRGDAGLGSLGGDTLSAAITAPVTAAESNTAVAVAPARSSTPSWLLPAAAAAGLLFLLTRKKPRANPARRRRRRRRSRSRR